MSKRQESIGFRCLPDLTLRGYRSDRTDNNSVSEWHCPWAGNAFDTLTTTASRAKFVEYDW